jgi:hypothetical protein
LLPGMTVMKLRSLLRRCGIALPFSNAICADYVKTISIDRDWRAQATVKQALVFLDVPESGDLHDTCAVDPGLALESFVFQSPDAVEVGRRKLGRNAIVATWEPRTRVTPYAIYDHQFSWFPSGSHSQPALSTEFHCDQKTGTFMFEMITPESFEAAVVFERPRWPLLNSEKQLIKYALTKLETGAERASILNNGQRVEWKILGPKLGTRYICVVFHHNGVLLWQDKLKKGTLLGRLRELFGRLAPT